MKNLNSFFNHISELRDLYKDKGDFNAFHSIGFSSQETMHSKFISILLDPKAQHSQKGRFLNLFIKYLKLDFVNENVIIKVEMPANKRRMDITIANNNSIIIIENKIRARDQERQLEDYYNFCKNAKYENVDLFYLTPYGTSPSDYSIGETLTRDKVNRISYEKVIIPWIEECIVESNGRLKVSLEMYNELLHKLINRDKYMNKIFEQLKDKEKLKLAIDINSSLKGRNYITEFPETVDFLISRIYQIVDDANPYMEENEPILNIADKEHEFTDWRFYFEDGGVYITNDNDKYIQLFDPSDINDEKLISLIFEDVIIADDWLSKLFDQIRNSQ